MFEHCKQTWGTKLVVTGTKELAPLPGQLGPPNVMMSHKGCSKGWPLYLTGTQNIDLGPADNTAQVSQNTSLPKVLARISNVWVYVGDNDIVIL